MGSAVLRVRLLGPVELLLGGKPVGPGGVKRRGLLTVLAVQANRVVSVSALVDALWGEEPPRSASHLVQTYVSAWRGALDPERAGVSGGRIVTSGAGYRLHLDRDELDLFGFTELLGRGRVAASSGRPQEAVGLFGQALGMWRGPALADLAGLPFQPAAAARLDELYAQAVEARAAAALGSGQAAELPDVTDSLRRLLEEQPLRERPAELLLWALFQTGRQAEALGVFEQTRRRLADELGADPGSGLTAMHGRVLRHDPELGPIPQPAAVSPRHHLPLLVDSFLGRDQEVTKVTKLIADYRLVTLTGPGGSGKTRLGVEVGAAAAGRADMGRVVFVDASALTEGRQLLDRVAGALDLPPAPGRTAEEMLASAFSDSPFLLVLDNLEQLSGAAAVAAELLRAGPGVRLLTTSREPLRTRGERVYPVLPLTAVPEAGQARPAAVELFLDRAAAAAPEFTVDDEETAAAVAGICRRLDGLPLAIELAAPWVRLLSAAEILARLAAPLALLAEPGGDRPDRQKTLRATLDWSYRLLDPAEQTMLARLSVFSGGADLDAIEAVCGPGLPGPVLGPLRGLVDNSLARPLRDSARPRYRLLETVRAYAAERLGTSDAEEAVLDRHAAHYTNLAEQIAVLSEGPAGQEWMSRARTDADNLRAAVDRHTDASRHRQALQVVTDLSVLWWNCGLVVEGQERLVAALDKAPLDATARPMAHALLGWLGLAGAAAEEQARMAIALARERGDLQTEAFALQTLGTLIRNSEGSAAVLAVPILEEAIRVARSGKRQPVRYAQAAWTSVVSGAAHDLCVSMMWRDLLAAQRWAEEALNCSKSLGDAPMIAVHWTTLAQVALLRGDHPTAERLLTAADLVFQSAGVPVYQVWCVHHLASLAHARGDDAEAERGYRKVIEMMQAAGMSSQALLAYGELVDVFIDRGELGLARQSLQLAERCLETRPDSAYVVLVRRARLARIAGDVEEVPRLLTQAAAALDPEELLLERMIWYVESAHTAFHAGDPNGAAGILNRAEEHAHRVRLAIWPGELRRINALRAALEAVRTASRQRMASADSTRIRRGRSGRGS